MIQSLSIENFALIEKLHIDFSEGFTVLTGETGAGKSIILGALGLLMGKRADLTSLMDEEKKCVIEGVFEISNYPVASFFTENDVDFENQTIIRREILPSAKSRAFINDTPVTLQQLQELAQLLIDIHSQHQNLELNEEKFQIELLDLIADNEKLLNDYSKTLLEYNNAKRSLKKLEDNRIQLLKDKEYNEFLLQELQQIKLDEINLDSLESELSTLNNVESIKEQFATIFSLAQDDNFGVVQNMKTIKNALQKIENYNENYAQLLERVSSVLVEFDDVVNEIELLNDKLFHDPEKLESLNQQLQIIHQLQRKHNVDTIDELLSIQEELMEKTYLAESIDEEISKIEKKINELETLLIKISNEISFKRKEVAPKIEKEISRIVTKLGMPDARFLFSINTTDKFLSTGTDTVSFLFSANIGSQMGILKKVASGGELSRIMLAVKSIIAKSKKLPTIIFDEIDAGISGDVAQKTGDIMQQMSHSMQLFAITHLPQIASKGNTHLKVFKTTNGNKTMTSIAKLSDKERIMEVAEMISGKDITESAVEHAKALLN